MQANELSRIYDTLLSIPGMNEEVKIGLKISRKNILLLSQVIENGANGETKEQGGILSVADKDTRAAILQVSNDLLEKSGLKEMKEKLNALQSK